MSFIISNIGTSVTFKWYSFFMLYKYLSVSKCHDFS